MDDLRATLAGFDADAPLPAAPDPWDFMPTPAARPGPPWAMAEMIAAEPGLADRVAARLVDDGSAARLAAAGQRVRVGRRAGRGHRVRHVRARRDGGRRDPPRGLAAPLAWPVAGRSRPRRSSCRSTRRPVGLVVGISHEGATTATIAAMAASRAAGARTALITGSAASPAAAAADVVVATVEMDRSWCHTVGYVSPIVAAAVTDSGRLAGGPAAVGRSRAAAGRGDRGGARRRRGAVARPDEAIAATIAGAVAGARRRHRRRSHRRTRDRPQARGGVLGARGGPGPRDLPARPPAGYGPETALLLVPDRARRPRGACQAGAPGVVGRRGPRHAAGGDPGRRRRGRDPRLA